jgi:hypothetical protein
VGFVGMVPRQTAMRWLKEARIDISLCRSKYLARIYQECQDYLAKRAGGQKLSRAIRRRDLLETVRRFNESMAKKSRRSREGGSESSEVA